MKKGKVPNCDLKYGLAALSKNLCPWTRAPSSQARVTSEKSVLSSREENIFVHESLKSGLARAIFVLLETSIFSQSTSLLLSHIENVHFLKMCSQRTRLMYHRRLIAEIFSISLPDDDSVVSNALINVGKYYGKARIKATAANFSQSQILSAANIPIVS